MRWAKRVLIGLLVLILVIGAGLATLVAVVDPNDYKSVIENAVKQRTNRTLIIDGDIRLSVLPRLGLEINSVSLSEPDSTQIFAAIDTARVAAAWLPLLSRHVVIDHVAISGVKANVVRDKDGRFNFDDLLSPHDATLDDDVVAPPPTPVPVPVPGAAPDATAPVPPTPGGQPIQLDIAGVDISGGELAVRDEITSIAFRLEKLSASASQISLARPFNFTMSARILGQAPRADANIQGQGQLELNPMLQRYAVGNLDMRINGVLPSVRANNVTVRGNASFSAWRQTLEASNLSLVFQGDVAANPPLSGVDAQLTAPKLAANLANGQINLQQLTFKATGRRGPDPFDVGLDAPQLDVTERSAGGGPITARVKLGGPNALDAQLSLTDVEGNAEGLKVGKVNLAGTARQGPRTYTFTAGSPLAANLKAKTLELPTLAADVKIEDPALPGGTPMQIPATGQVRIDFARERANGKLAATIDGGKVDVQAEVTGFEQPDVRFTLAADTLDLDKLLPPLAVTLPTPPQSSGKGDGSADAAKADKTPAPDTPIDLSALRAVDATGTVRIAHVKMRAVEAANVSAAIKLNKGRADVTAIKATLYEGQLGGSLHADANTSRLGANLKLTGVALQPLLTAVASNDTLSGRGTVSLTLDTAGKTVQTLKQGLNGNVQLQVRDGAIKGINIAQTLRTFKGILGQAPDATQANDRAHQTDFSELRAQVAFANGVGTVHNLMLAAPLLRVTEGKPATINLATDTVDLVLNARVVNTSTGQDGKALEHLKDVTVPVRVTGPFATPAYSVQWSQIGSETLKNVLQSEAQRQIGRLLDKNGTGSNDEAAKTLGNALKGLFRQ